MKKALLLIIIFIYISQTTINAQVKREIRAVWLTTVLNLDWPDKNFINSPEAQKKQLIKILDYIELLNFNVVFFQIRNECDAFYKSKYEPWSRYLTGKQGKDPGYDPLQFAVKECHKRGLEIHAWLNPYRVNVVKFSNASQYFDSSHIYKKKPELILKYDNGKYILNPGDPKVQQHIKNVVGDIINNYDVDGIHFDDYFYSYSGTPNSLDNSVYNKYGKIYKNKADFRRGSINQMVADVYDTINRVKPYIRFGISPFGIYGNGQMPKGIRGMDAYKTIYCDPINWLQNKTVDYICPQLYWPTGGQQDYEKLLNWWSNEVAKYNRHLIVGHGIYRMPKNLNKNKLKRFFQRTGIFFERLFKGNNAQKADLWDMKQLYKQIDLIRNDKKVAGSSFFRYDFIPEIYGLSSEIKSTIYSTKSIPTAMYWKSDNLSLPTELELKNDTASNKVILKWKSKQKNQRYVIYVCPKNKTKYISNPKYIFKISYKNYIKIPAFMAKSMKIGITTLSRSGFESEMILLN